MYKSAYNRSKDNLHMALYMKAFTYGICEVMKEIT